ncbi:caspase family protein [Myxococcota bacterium]|nr:caspase family protein [Myxococcota bacterium]
MLLLPLLLSLICTPALAQEAPARAPAVQPALETARRASDDIAIVIGVESYDALPQATYARADARAWAEWLQQGRGLRSTKIYRLEDPTTAQIQAELKRRAGKAKRGSTVWLVFAGHGAMTAEKDGQRVLLGRDADPDTPGSGGVSLQAVADAALKGRRAARVVLVLDAAFDGRGRDGLELVPGQRSAVPDADPSSDDARVTTWSAAPGADPVPAWAGAGHSAFSWAALGALRGWADGEVDGQRDGKVTLAEADAYAAWTRRQLGIPAREGLRGAGGDLVLVEAGALEEGPSAETLSALSAERRRQRFADAEALLHAEAAAFWQHTLDQARQGGEGGRKALEAFIQEFGAKEIAITWTLALPEVREARHLLARYDEKGAGQEAVAEVVAVAQAVADESCDDLVALEPAAMMGSLSPGQLSCLDLRVRTDRLQTAREKASMVLIANAQAAGDQGRWASMVQRHIDQISRADPALIMQYAVWLFRTDPLENGEDAIHWAGVALENKQRWEGESYVKNVGALMRIRAEAAYKLWVDADRQYRQAPDEALEWQAEDWRGQAKDLSREWLDYLRAAGLETDLAEQLCTSAAGTTDFCRPR